MTRDRPTAKAVDHACTTALATLGFNARYDVATFPISENFVGWVGLNMGVHPDFIRVNPNVGVHCIPMMKLIEELEGKRYRLGEFATYSEHMGVLCHDVDQFLFRSESDLVPEASRLAQTIREPLQKSSNIHVVR